MARCLALQDFSVDWDDGACIVTLEAQGLHHVEWFERLLGAAFPDCEFQRMGAPEDAGLLGFEKVLRLQGDMPRRPEDIGEYLSLLNSTLTIEDLLDESHALGYHQLEDETTGELIRSPLGTLVRDAKYRSDNAAVGRIQTALRNFIERHPRYRRADVLTAVPPHESGRRDSLCRRLVAGLATQLRIASATISRASTRPPQKDIVDEDRKIGVERRIANQRNTMTAHENVAGCTAVVLDDLYGSGGSMQEAARALRQQGASQILGLTITKQRLFEGVRMTSQD